MNRLGLRVVRLTAAWFGHDVAYRVFEPLVADWQREWASSASWSFRARCLASGSFSLVASSIVTALSLASPRHAPREVMRGLIATGLTFGGIGASLLLLPFATQMRAGPLPTMVALLTLMPSALALSIPLALLPASMSFAVRLPCDFRPRGRWILAGVVALTTVAMVATLGWIVPSANHAFRRTMVAVTSHASSGPLPRGVRELSLPELLHAPASALSVATGVTSQHVREELRQRLAIAIGWPGALALLGWRLGRHRTEAGRLATVGWWAAIAVTALALLSTPLRHVSYLSAAPALFPATVWLAAAVALRPKTGRARVSRGSGRDRHAKAPGRGAGYP